MVSFRIEMNHKIYIVSEKYFFIEWAFHRKKTWNKNTITYEWIEKISQYRLHCMCYRKTDKSKNIQKMNKEQIEIYLCYSTSWKMSKKLTLRMSDSLTSSSIMGAAIDQSIITTMTMIFKSTDTRTDVIIPVGPKW